MPKYLVAIVKKSYEKEMKEKEKRKKEREKEQEKEGGGDEDFGGGGGGGFGDREEEPPPGENEEPPPTSPKDKEEKEEVQENVLVPIYVESTHSIKNDAVLAALLSASRMRSTDERMKAREIKEALQPYLGDYQDARTALTEANRYTRSKEKETGGMPY